MIKGGKTVPAALMRSMPVIHSCPACYDPSARLFVDTNQSPCRLAFPNRDSGLIHVVNVVCFVVMFSKLSCNRINSALHSIIIGSLESCSFQLTSPNTSDLWMSGSKVVDPYVLVDLWL